MLPRTLGFGLIDEFILQFFEDLIAIATSKLTLQFSERKRNHVVMMKSPTRRIGGGDLKPNLMQQFDVFRAEAGRVWAE